MIERDVALQILGLPEDADEIEVGSAYRALRDHIARRLASGSTEVEREARRSELRDLERALRSLSSVPVSRGAVSLPRAPRGVDGSPGFSKLATRWVAAWAIVATLLAGGLGVVLVRGSESFRPAVLVGGAGSGGSGTGGFALEGAGSEDASEAEAGAPGEVHSAGARGQLVAKSRVEGAGLLISRRGAAGQPSEVVAEGAADETVYWLSPGEYALAVAHPECPDEWERKVSVVAGESYAFAPEVCRSTGWVVVHSDQQDDTVSIDGQKLGPSTDRQHALSAGEHEVRVEKEGYEAWEGVVAVAPGQVVGLRPRLARAQRKQAPEVARRAAGEPPPRVGVAAPPPPNEGHEAGFERSGWHEKAKQWLLARYDEDRSGKLDTQSEVEEVPCEQWLGLEQSHDASGLKLRLTDMYGFNGNRWKEGSLGVDGGVRDIAYKRMRECGLR